MYIASEADQIRSSVAKGGGKKEEGRRKKEASTFMYEVLSISDGGHLPGG